MQNLIPPAIWLIVLIVGLPQFSETVYTPSLSIIAHSLNTSDSMVEYTLTIYLFGLGVGTIFWGNISDYYGRKPCILLGFIIFILACLGCYFTTSIKMLMICRFIQSFGGSVSSVLGQAICRDVFTGAQLGKVFSSVGSSIAVFPAIGPIIGGIIAQYWGWNNIFLVLIIFASTLFIIVYYSLSETLPIGNRSRISFIKIAKSLFTNKMVIGFGLLVAGCNGMIFSYYAEAPFYLIEQLKLTPSQYGSSFIFIASFTMLGGVFSRYLHNFYNSKTIIYFGLVILIVNEFIFTIFILMNNYQNMLSIDQLIKITILCHMCRMFGICMVNSNALALALLDYKHSIGTASSIFGLFYYVLISLFTLGMGYLHNDTLLPMPIYFLGITIFMIIVTNTLLKERRV